VAAVTPVAWTGGDRHKDWLDRTAGLLTIKHDGDTYRVLGLGVVRDGMVYCHLASTTRGRQQRNGWMPLQGCDWIDTIKVPL
jgi:hypothetical protein